MFSLAVAIISGLQAASAAECDGASTAAELGSHLDEAVLAYATLDEDGFHRAYQDATTSLRCLDATITPAQASAVYRVTGLDAFLAGDPDRALLAFRAAVQIEPNHVLSTRIAPEGGKLFRIYDAAKSADSSTMVGFDEQTGVGAYVDGEATWVHAEELPAIVQLEQGGRVRFSGLVWPGEALPSFGTSSVAVAAVEQPVATAAVVTESTTTVDPVVTSTTSTSSAIEKKPKTGLMVAGALTGLTAAGLYGGSIYLRSEFEKSPTELGYHATNGAWYGAVGLGVLSFGLIVGGAF